LRPSDFGLWLGMFRLLVFTLWLNRIEVERLWALLMACLWELSPRGLEATRLLESIVLGKVLDVNCALRP
jgi:hypothetical protein